MSLLGSDFVFCGSLGSEFLMDSDSGFTAGLDVAFVAEAGVKATAIMVTVRLATKWTGMGRDGVLFDGLLGVRFGFFPTPVFLLVLVFLLAKKPSMARWLEKGFCI